MKTICVLTFGTSDVQIIKGELPEGFSITPENKLVVIKNNKKISVNIRQNRYLQDSYLLAKARNDGKTILDNFEIFYPVIQLPLTLPLIENFQSNNKRIDKFVLVFTDQVNNNQPDNEDFKAGDSLYVAEIFKRILIHKFKYTEENFIDFPVKEKVTDYDYQFTRMGKKCKEIIAYKPEEIEKIYILPQGGIDQINTSLTLQLIKCYGSKAEIYQTPEKNKTRRIYFAEIYLRDLTFDNMVTLAEKGDYAGGLLLLKRLEEKKFLNLESLLKFGDLKINARFKEIQNIGKNSFENKIVPDIILEAKNKIPHCNKKIIELFGNSDDIKNEYAYRVSEYFEIARFFNRQETRNRFIMAFAIFIESFLNHLISIITNIDLVSNSLNYYTESKKILSQIRNDTEIKEILKNNFRGDYYTIESLSVPVLLAISLKYYKDNDLIRLICSANGKYNNSVCNIDDLRNDIAHRCKGISETDYNKVKDLFDEILRQFTDKKSSFEALNEVIESTINDYRTRDFK